jgi:hypothetical protein
LHAYKCSLRACNGGLHTFKDRFHVRNELSRVLKQPPQACNGAFAAHKRSLLARRDPLMARRDPLLAREDVLHGRKGASPAHSAAPGAPDGMPPAPVQTAGTFHPLQEDDMATFPRTEPEIAALALVVKDGLAQAAEDFPAPPVPPQDLQARLETYNAAKTATVTAESTARERHAVKDDALEALVDGIKANLRYAEVAVREHPEKLALLGWSPPRAGKGVEPPGEVRDAAMPAQGPGWVLLDWKAPVDGGAVSAYTIQRRRRTEEHWQDIGTSVDSEALIQNQERGVEFEYRILAVNKAGTGKPSAAVAVTL